jgi:putative endonuclease
MRLFYVYIMNNETGTLYVGMTNNLARRVWEHKNGVNEGFTKQYKIHRLAYYEVAPDATSAIAREKQLKGYSRAKKLALIKGMNPTWRDLSEDFSDDSCDDSPA